MGLGFDPEVPRGYQDADIVQAQYEQESAEAARLHRLGVCTHGWMLGGSPHVDLTRAEIEVDRQRGMFPSRPTDQRVQSQRAIPAGQVLCLDCGQLMADPLEGR